MLDPEDLREMLAQQDRTVPRDRPARKAIPESRVPLVIPVQRVPRGQLDRPVPTVRRVL